MIVANEHTYTLGIPIASGDFKVFKKVRLRGKTEGFCGGQPSQNELTISALPVEYLSATQHLSLIPLNETAQV